MVMSFRFVSIVEADDPKWPKGYSVPYNITLRNKTRGREKFFQSRHCSRIASACLLNMASIRSCITSCGFFPVSFSFQLFLNLQVSFLQHFWSCCVEVSRLTTWGLSSWLGSTLHRTQGLDNKGDNSVGSQLTSVLLLPQLFPAGVTTQNKFQTLKKIKVTFFLHRYKDSTSLSAPRQV